MTVCVYIVVVKVQGVSCSVIVPRVMTSDLCTNNFKSMCSSALNPFAGPDRRRRPHLYRLMNTSTGLDCYELDPS
jgi:hypothetical protein